MEMLFGILLVSIGGLVMGSLGWPMKLMKKFQFEHWWFIGMLLGLFVVPWVVTLAACPNAIEAYKSVGSSVLIKSNLFSLCWGIANVLLGICFVRIGISLSFAILTGVGVSFGVTIPMVVKGSGLFSQACDLTSPAGKLVLLGVGVMIVGIVLVAFAGFGREKMLHTAQHKSGGFLGGLIMSLLAGVLSAGISFAFVYSQGPIVEAMQARGAGAIPANISVWAVGLLAGGLVNILYPAFLMTKNKSWLVLRDSLKEVGLSLIIGINFIAAVTLMGKGMLLLGSLGASVGFGIQQAMQILGGQVVGFISGEWKGIHGKPIRQMYIAIIILVLAATIMAYSNTLSKS
jgi:hypothetical protein